MYYVLMLIMDTGMIYVVVSLNMEAI